MKKLHLFLYIASLMSVTLACGLQTSEPVRNEVAFYAPTQAERKTSTEVKFTVTADLLHVREGAGTQYPAIDGLELHRGEVVTCLEMSGSWCRHWQGWSHSAWMEGIK